MCLDEPRVLKLYADLFFLRNGSYAFVFNILFNFVVEKVMVGLDLCTVHPMVEKRLL